MDITVAETMVSTGATGLISRDFKDLNYTLIMTSELMRSRPVSKRLHGNYMGFYYLFIYMAE